MNAIQKAIEGLCEAEDFMSDTAPAWQYTKVAEALTALRGIEAGDVDEITRNVMKVFDEYKYGDSSRPHSFYDEKKPTLVWLIEHLHASGYLGKLPVIEGLEYALRCVPEEDGESPIIKAAQEYQRISE